MRYVLAILCLLIGWTAQAAPIELIARGPDSAQALSASAAMTGMPATTMQSARFNADAAFALAPGDEAMLSLQRGFSFRVTHERSERHPSGSRSWVGYLSSEGKSYRVILTQGANASYGRMFTPHGEFVLETNTHGQWLFDLTAAGTRMLAPDAGHADTRRVPPPTKLAPAAPTLAEKSGSPSTVDMLVVYTPSMVTRLGSVANVRTRVDHLVALSNQAYIDSQIALTMRLMSLQAVSYSDTTSNQTALNEITGTDGSSPVTIPASLTPVAGWRNTYGADLVVLMRSFSQAHSGGNCGIAWLSVSRWNDVVSGNDSFGYGVVSDGWDGNVGCGEYTYTHEVGHLFGATHDRVTESQPNGADPTLSYPYAYGYGVSGVLYTIMAYGSSFGWPTQYGVFSNPNITCGGQACGKAVNQPDAAYNALALDNTRTIVAAYRPTAVMMVQRAYVSAKRGDDVNTATGCAAAAPCRWFATAVTAVNPGGEVVAMDSGAYGAVTLNNSIALNAAPGVYAGITVFSGNGVTVATPGIAVTLRGLTINGLGGSNGVSMSSGAKLSIENCVIANFASGAGISVTTPASVRVFDTLLRDNQTGLLLTSGATASVSRASVMGNGRGIQVTTSSATITSATIANTVASTNATAISAQATVGGASSIVTLSNNTITENTTVGIEQAQSGGGVSTVETLGENTVRANASNFSGVLTPVPAI